MDTACEMDIQQLKMQRARERKVNILRRRCDYKQSQERQSLIKSAGKDLKSSTGHDQAKPHRAARAALRTFLARNAIETESDVPIISMGHPGCRKPSVSPLLTYQDHPIYDELTLNGLDLDFSDDKGAAMLQVDNCDTTASEGKEESSESELDIETAMPHSAIGANKEAPCDLSAAAVFQQETQSCQDAESDKATCDAPQAAIGAAGVENKFQAAENCTATRREAIIREVASQLQNRVREAEKTAAAAEARADEIKSFMARREAPPKCIRKDIKQALQLEKQRAAALRKKRSQTAHVQALQDNAKRALQEAREMRDKAENEADEVKAGLLLQANVDAQSEATMWAQQEILFAQVEAEDLKEAGLNAKVEIEARAQSELAAVKSRAEDEILQMKAHAEEEMNAQADAAIQAAQAAAEAEALAVKEKALADAHALLIRVEQQMASKTEADERIRLVFLEDARTQAEVQARQDVEMKLQLEVKKFQAKEIREDAMRMKQAKELEQQRARQFRKQAQMERKLEQQKQQEFEAIRSQAAKEVEEAMKQAAAEASRMKTRAKADARAIRARARCEALAQANLEASKKLEVAQAEAQVTKIRAEQEAQETHSRLAEERLQAQAILHSMKGVENVAACPVSPMAAAAGVEDTDEWQLLQAPLLQPISGASDWDIIA